MIDSFDDVIVGDPSGLGFDAWGRLVLDGKECWIRLNTRRELVPDDFPIRPTQIVAGAETRDLFGFFDGLGLVVSRILRYAQRNGGWGSFTVRDILPESERYLQLLCDAGWLHQRDDGRYCFTVGLALFFLVMFPAQSVAPV